MSAPTRRWLGMMLGAGAILAVAGVSVSCGDSGDAPGDAGSLRPDSGTSGTGGGGAGGPMDATADQATTPLTKRKACRDYLAAVCARFEVCLGPTHRGCLAKQDQCPDYLFSPGSTRTIESVEACLPAIAALSCDDLNTANFPACSTPGTK